MKHYANVTREVDASRRGKKTVAFFDFDGTLLAGFSVLFFLYRRYLKGQANSQEILDQVLAMGDYALSGSNFSALLTDFAASLSGVAEAELLELEQEVFRKDLAGRLYPESRALIKAHQDRGHTVVILSSATQYQLGLAAEELGVDQVICSRLEVSDGKLTGRMVGPACYGMEKYAAASDFCRQNAIDLNRSFFYTDGVEDIPLLEAVGRPRPINPDRKLAALALDRGWPVQNFDSRGLPRLAEIIRTGLVYGSLLPSFLLGAPAWLLNHSRRNAVNLGLSVWSDFGSAVAGLDVHVEGEKHVWTQRPAVFIFNHQSALDALIVARLLRQDFTGIAKKEMQNNPLLAPALKFADVVFIDRNGRGDPAEAMQPALDKLASGLSLAIAPEGQRSAGYRLGPFKKGAFHIAMQAGVPVVPIVIANSSDGLPKSGIFIRPATIDVTVLPPIPTDNWTAETMEQHVRHCRQLFLRELGQSGEDDARTGGG